MQNSNNKGSHCGCCGNWMEGVISDHGCDLCDTCKRIGCDIIPQEGREDERTK